MVLRKEDTVVKWQVDASRDLKYSSFSSLSRVENLMPRLAEDRTSL